MLADLDLLLIAVFCAADDLLPRRVGNGKRILADAEVVTLAVAQAIMGIPSDERFLAVARKRLCHLFPRLPKRPGYYKRRQRLSDQIEALIAVFARDSPGYHDDLVLVDSTPIECARSIETTRRSELADAADYGYSAAHNRYFWGFRLHGLFALDGTPRASNSPPPRHPSERSASNCSHASTATSRSRSSATKATPAASSPRPSANTRQQSSAQNAETNPAPGHTSHRSGNESNRSSTPAKTSSPSNATAPAPCTASAPASANASSHSPPQSASTTASADQREPSSTTSHSPVELLI
jgi:hypothetical protein